MNDHIKSTKTLIALLIIGAFSLVAGWSYVFAWTGPSQNPPSGNAEIPITALGTDQVKSGNLTVTDFVADSVTVGTVTNSGAVTSPKFCIGTDCITAWW